MRLLVGVLPGDEQAKVARMSEDDLIKWLKRLSCQVEKAGAHLKVTAPEFRVDLEQDVDLVEEYGRLNGYDHIPAALPMMSYAPLTQDKGFFFDQRLSELARTAGLSQCVNFGFTSAKFQTATLGPIEAYRAAGLEMDPQPVALQNPLNEDLDVMRVSLVPGLLKNLLHNIRHGNSAGRLFETGFVFRHGPEGYLQDARIAIVAWGLGQNLWQKSGKDEQLFFEIKARVQNLLERLGINSAQFNPWTNGTAQLLHPAQAATIFVEGRNIGYIGTVHPKWASQEKLRVPAVVVELDTKALSRGQPRVVKFKPVSKFPAVERDLAFVLPKTLAASDVAAEIKKTSGALLQSIDVFDVFEGGNLPEGHLSVAYRMIFQDHEGTLNDETLTALQSQIVANVEKKLNVKVR